VLNITSLQLISAKVRVLRKPWLEEVWQAGGELQKRFPKLLVLRLDLSRDNLIYRQRKIAGTDP
jgi:hypothetical protein